MSNKAHLPAKPGAAHKLMTPDWWVLYSFAMPGKSLATGWYKNADGGSSSSGSRKQVAEKLHSPTRPGNLGTFHTIKFSAKRAHNSFRR